MVPNSTPGVLYNTIFFYSSTLINNYELFIYLFNEHKFKYYITNYIIVITIYVYKYNNYCTLNY